MAPPSENVGAHGATVPLYLEPILIELEVGRYMGPILPVPLEDLVSGRHDGGGSGGGGISGGGNGVDVKGYGHSSGRGSVGGGGYGERGGGAGWGGAGTGGGGDGSTRRVRVRYDAHMPTLSLRVGLIFNTILSGEILPTVQGHILCKN